MTIPTLPGGPLIVDSRMGDLTINGVEMMGVAWQMLDLKVLWEPGKQRGTNRLLPGTSGVKAYRKRVTETPYSMPMVITGFVDRSGAAQANPYAGLENNVSYLRSNVVDPTNVGDGTRASVLTMPSGATRSANIHVMGLVLGNQAGPIVLATLEIEIPAGVYV